MICKKCSGTGSIIVHSDPSLYRPYVKSVNYKSCFSLGLPLWYSTLIILGFFVGSFVGAIFAGGVVTGVVMLLMYFFRIMGFVFISVFGEPPGINVIKYCWRFNSSDEEAIKSMFPYFVVVAIPIILIISIRAILIYWRELSVDRYKKELGI